MVKMSQSCRTETSVVLKLFCYSFNFFYRPCRTETSVVLKFCGVDLSRTDDFRSNRNKCCIEMPPKREHLENEFMSNRNKCCIEIYTFIKNVCEIFLVEPKQVLY